MNTPGSNNKKKAVILALLILSVPVFFMTLRGVRAPKPSPSNEVTGEVAAEVATPSGTLVPAKLARETSDAVIATSGDSKNTATKASATKNGATGAIHSSTVPLTSVAPQPRGLLSRLLTGIGLDRSKPIESTNVGTGAMPAAGTPISPNLPSIGTQVAKEIAPPAIPEPTEGCVTESFRHKKASGHSTEEACAQHRNLIRLKHPNISQVCFRINGTPVAFQPVKGKNDEFMIGSREGGAIAGPRAVITARYCFGKTRCNEDCTIPKDDFMSAIGGNDEPKQLAQWDASDAADKDSDVSAHLDADMKKELDRLDEKPADELFADWVSGTETPACGTQHAMN